MLILDKSLLRSYELNCFIQASLHNQVVEYLPYGVLIGDSSVQPVSSDSIFQIGSISKLLTSCIVFCLCKKGLIDLHYPYQVCDASDPRSFTLCELMQHRSGIVNHIGYSGFNINDSSKQLPESLETELRNHYYSGYQSIYHYCGINYRAIQRILEVQLKTPFEDLLCEMICEPLKLIHTTSCVSKLDRALTIEGCDQHGNKLEGGWNLFTGCEAAAGIWSSASDLCQLMKALLKSTKESESSSFNTTWRDLVNTKQSGRYRFGCFVINAQSCLRLGHSGRNPGYQSIFWFNPRNKVGVVTLWNDDRINSQIEAAIVKHL